MVPLPPTAVTAIRWAARGLAVLLFLFWGQFFVMHLKEWFIDPDRLPPPRVFFIVGLHLALLVGYLAGWRWELAGALLVLAAAWSFFYFAAGPNFVLFASLSSLPALLWLLCALAATRPAAGLVPHP